MRKSRVSILALLTLVAAMLACNLPTTPLALPATVPPSAEAPPTEIAPSTVAPPTPPDARGPGFAAYPEIAVTLPEAYQGYALPVDLAALGNYGQLWRVNRRWAVGNQIVTVTYTHGYSTIPDDIVAVCTRAAARAYQAGLRAEDAGGVPGVASKALGDFSVSFAAEGSEGVMGVSAARMLLLSEKDMLNKYRSDP